MKSEVGNVFSCLQNALLYDNVNVLMFHVVSDLKQEIQIHERHHADNNKSVERVRNSIVDSNKLQAELESNSPAGQIVSQTIPPHNTTTSPIKSRIYNTFLKAKRIFQFTSKKTIKMKKHNN